MKERRQDQANVSSSTRHIQQPLPESTTKSNAPYLNTITTQLAAIAPDLQNLNTYRYARQVSGGLQEYVEAASFQHYLETGTLLGPDAATSALDPSITLGHEDYLLGIYDMTGELMRFAITSMATHQSVPTLTLEGSEHQRNILTDMRQLRAALESLECGSGPFAKDADKKGEVMRVSVEKVERALYGLTVRGAERPKGWMPAFEEVGRGLEVEA